VKEALTSSSYILITSARNEEAHIEETIRAVVAQTRRPLKWLIISDGSVDRTDEIVGRYAAQYPFIELMRAAADKTRNFGSKARAINSGYEKIRHIEVSFVGILDADVTFAPDYYEEVMKRMAGRLELGLAGGVLFDRINDRFVLQITDPEWSVSGPIQMFRKECFDAIGGYLEVRGGIDAAAEVMARMKGWKVRAFPDLHVWHHRQTGTEQRHLVSVFLKRGMEDYQLGYHVLFFAGHAGRRLFESPWVIGSLLMVAGYAWAFLRRAPRKVSKEFIRHLHNEQWARMKACFSIRQGGAL
jgi:biofilm PGA synthesis N-glycosyltransferase PgaC